jgi:hypothetical protein
MEDNIYEKVLYLKNKKIKLCLKILIYLIKLNFENEIYKINNVNKNYILS